RRIPRLRLRVRFRLAAADLLGGGGWARAAGIVAPGRGTRRLGRRRVCLDAAVRMPAARLALALRDLLDRAAAHRRPGLLLQNVRVLGTALPFVMRLDEQPVVLGFSGSAPHPHEMPAAVEFLAFKREIEMAFLEPSYRITVRMPSSAVPDQHGAAAIFSR